MLWVNYYMMVLWTNIFLKIFFLEFRAFLPERNKSSTAAKMLDFNQ